jgi:hypothetical protein
VSELEGLLAAQRAREYRSGMDVATAGGQLGMVQQRNRMLEEQVGGTVITAGALL